MYKRLLDLYPSQNNQLEFCLGSLAEMTEGDIYEATKQYADHISYIHFRNVKGKVPHYQEVFVDEGDIDMPRIIRILKEKKFNGVLIPDHTPQMSCEGSWYAGIAYALGYMKALIQIC
jgi:mannonate dehydratase